MKQKKGAHRVVRMADLIQQSLARAILLEMSNPLFQKVTVTGVELSKDFSYAKVYVSVFADDLDIKRTVTALNDEHKFLRQCVARDVKMRVIPQLKFVYDDSVARGFKISALIEANKSSSSSESSDDNS